MKRPTPFGKYLLLDRINVGGMAEVFLAKSFGVAGFERLVAIKKILPTMVEDDEFITMFIDEARIAVQLNHANIVQIYELGKHDENYFIAMEYVSGRDMRTLLDKAKVKGELIPQGLAVYVAQKVCEGLDYAHRKKDPRGRDLGIIHRDVSPQNVLVSFDGEVKVIDFGIAKAANRGQKTQAGILKGKFGYMSPEQVRGLPIDRRSDIFAVGVCLYELLTGEKLFVSESDFSTLEKVRNAEVPPPREVNANIPEGLETVVMKALARDVEERYQWASDMQEDLMRFLLLDGKMFGAKHLATFMHEGFAQAIEAENETLEEYAQISAPPELLNEGTQTSPEPAVRPEEHFDEPPPEMQASSDDATQLFDASEHFAPGDGPDEQREPPDEGLPPPPVEEDGPPEQQTGGEPRAAGQESDLRAEWDEGAHPVPPGDDEDTATPVSGAEDDRISGPLGEPGAMSHQEAVGRFASEIPSVPDGQVPDELREDEPELMEEATRITTAGEGLKAPSIRSSRPSATHAAAAASARGARPEKRPRPKGAAPRARGGGRGKLLAALGGLMVVAAVLVAVYVAMDRRPGDLIVMTTPAEGIEIFIDDKVVAYESPHVITGLAPGVYQVAIRLPGTRDRHAETIEVVSGGRAEVHLALTTDAAPLVAKVDTDQAPSADPGSSGEGEEVADAGEEIEPEVEEPPELGKAIIRSNPSGASVARNGDSVGTTPVTIDDLALDEAHRYVVTMDGYKEETVVVDFDASDSQDVTVRLERVRAPPRPDPQLVEKRRAQQEARRKAAEERRRRQQAAEQRRRQAAQAKQAAGSGTLVAMTNPVAHVIVNGRETGRWTPVAPGDPLELPAGVHEITFRADDGRTHSRRVTIQADQETRLVGISF